MAGDGQHCPIWRDIPVANCGKQAASGVAPFFIKSICPSRRPGPPPNTDSAPLGRRLPHQADIMEKLFADKLVQKGLSSIKEGRCLLNVKASSKERQALSFICYNHSGIAVLFPISPNLVPCYHLLCNKPY